MPREDLTVVLIDTTLVRQLIDDQYPAWSTLPIEPVPTSGWDNRTFRLGDDMLVRLPSAAHYADAVAREQRWLPWLAPRLPLPIPEPLAEGAPGFGYLWPWSVYRWLEGEVATSNTVTDLERFAADLAHFLQALQLIETVDGPAATFRGGSLAGCEAQVADAISLLGRRVGFDVEAARAIWAAAVRAPMDAEPVWFHGDVAAGNLLVQGGRLSAVIDFGGLGVGDPACDTTIAWTFLDSSSRRIFREQLGVSDAVWDRGRGWALWKALIVEAGLIETNAREKASTGYTIEQLFADYRTSGA